MKKLVLLLVLVITIVSAHARKFYFSSSTGNDSYTTTQAQNQATPWASLRKLTQLTTGTNGPSVFRAGDTICFKRGEVFANGSSTDTYCSAYWWNDGGTYFTAPSGTPTNPIVITNYGDVSLPLPNWLHPRAFYPVSSWAPHIDSANASIGITSRVTRENRVIIEFAGVHDIIIDGIQSNDYRVPAYDKTNPGYSGGWIIGEWLRGTSSIPRNSYTDSTRRTHMVTRFTIKNCVFNNTMYGINGFAGIDSKVTNCTFTNFKSTADTAGTNDVLGAALESIYGIRCEFSNNYIKGAWAKSGRISSTNGLGGVAFDLFNLYNSKICYNTIIDCSGAIEIGNLDRYDSIAGFQYDTIAFNKIINTAQFGYFHGTGFFAGNNHHVAVWNNVIVLNNKDRQNGIGFGADTYGDGQGWRPGTTQPWWFCRDPYSTFNQEPARPIISTIAGSNSITVSSNTGIFVGSVFFMDNDSLASLTYKTVTVTNINGNTITLSNPCTATRTNFTLSNMSGFYLPVSNTTWSNPQNPAYSNYGGTRSFIQYASDATVYGSWIDTMFDSRNNIIYWTTGLQGVYDRSRFKRKNNIYCPIGALRYPTTLGGTLQTGEKLITSKIFRDTTATYPENWDLHPVDTSYAYTGGTPISGFTKDFEGNPITTPFIGLYTKLSVVQIDTCRFTYGQWSTCTNNIQTRPYTSSPANCIGNPPLDSIQRTCTNAIIIKYFYYNNSRKSIRIDCNYPGVVTVSSVLGNITRTYSYQANGQWINVSTLPTGTYFASTYGRSFTFIR